MHHNVLFITVDQWRGDCLSAVGHPLLRTPALDALGAGGVVFANHWSNSAPCGPARACLYTGTYQHHNRVVQNGTPLDARFENLATVARDTGYDPVLFGYTDITVDPRTVPDDDPRLFTYEGVLPGFRAVVEDPWEQGSPAWGRWLAAKGLEVPANPHDLYLPVEGFPGSDGHGSTWAPARFAPEHSQSAFIVESVIDWIDRNGAEPFFIHASFIRPHPPRRNPPGYHDLYDADDVAAFVAAPTKQAEARLHPFNGLVLSSPEIAAPDDERERRQIRATYYGAQREVDDQLGRLFSYLGGEGLRGSTLVVVTSDHGEMGGDHWLLEKLGYWDESFRVPLIVADPDPAADPARGTQVTEPTEAVDVLPTVCDWLGVPTPLQVDGWSLAEFLRSGAAPEHWRTEAHMEWSFSNPATLMAERGLGLPMSHCSLAVGRGPHEKYVQFAADRTLFPPLFFDLDDDPSQLSDLAGEPDAAGRVWHAAERLLQWRMRSEDQVLSGRLADPERGMVSERDAWS
jgi:arylsulfatase A-like enzyme